MVNGGATPIDNLKSVYKAVAEHLDPSTVFNVATESQAILTKIVTFCLYNFITLFCTIGSLTY